MTPAAANDVGESRGAVTIGLVEDDPDQVALYSNWLAEAGYRVRAYGSAAEFRFPDGERAQLVEPGLGDDERDQRQVRQAKPGAADPGPASPAPGSG